MYHHRERLSRKINLKSRKFATERLFRDATYIRKHILRIRESRIDACGTDIYAMHEWDSRRCHEPQNVKASRCIYSKRTEMVCIVVSEREMDELKFGVFEHCLRSSFLEIMNGSFLRVKVSRRLENERVYL